MNKLTRSSPSLSQNENGSTLEDFKDTCLDIEDGKRPLSRNKDIEASLNASTPCLTTSRPSSSVGTGCDWEEPWISNMANSDSCLVSSSSNNTSPLTGASSQGISPIDAENKVFSFEADSKERGDFLPSINDALQTEKDFMEYVMSFPISVQTMLRRPEAKKSPNESSPKVGLDHLDNLCKLMEQLSDLKEANFKLKRRVQYLEDLKTLHEIHKEMISVSATINSGPSDEEEHQKNKSNKLKQKISPGRGRSEERKKSPPYFDDDDDDERPEFSTGLHRSKTTTEVDSRLEQKRDSDRSSRSGVLVRKEKVRERSKSVGHPGIHPKSKKRSSRWSKVKEVLGIEKQDPEETKCNHSQYSLNTSNDKVTDNTMINCELIAYHAADSEQRKREVSKGHKERPRSGILLSNNFSKSETVSPNIKDKKIDEAENQSPEQKTFSAVEKYDAGSKRLPKTPWSRMKTMITIRRDCRNQKSESSSSSSRGAPEKTANDTSDIVSNSQQSHRRNGRSSRKSSFTLQEVPKKYSHETKNPHPENSNEYKDTSGNSQVPRQKRLSTEQIQRNDQQEQDLQRTKSEKSKPTHQVESNETYNTNEIESNERTLSINADTKSEKTTKEKTTNFNDNKKQESVLLELQKDTSVISPKIKRKVSSSTDASKEKEVEPHLSTQELLKTKENLSIHPCATATVTELLKELQQNLSDDFNRKLEEWHRFRGNEGIKPQTTDVERKDSFGRFRKFSKLEKKGTAGDKTTKHSVNVPKKDLNWLEKELQKIEREILRLTKEKQKFEKRAFRLQKLKDAMMDSHKKNEVLVRTPAGEFRFEGISNAFTKKLYEWETKQGVGPELSTIALLDESLNPQENQVQLDERLSITDVDKRSITTTSDHSEKFCYQKSSSEPDLSTLTAVQKDLSGTLQTVRSKSGDTLLASSDESMISSSNKINRNNHDDKSTDIQEVHSVKCTELAQNPEDNYYSLLEENMFLLDQLKGKEDICSRLQTELDRLDEKAEKANQNHQEEMEKYRQKLWEIHMSRPRDLQGSLQLISELKTRIDELQKCSDKLKSDREKLEQSFRYHSEQQRQLADDLIQRMVELQEVELPAIFNRKGCKRKWQKTFKCDAGSVARIHELSTKLLQQAREMEEALAEKTRQVCHLRWELLHRDMSAVLLQAALHRVTSQGPQASIIPAWDMKRIKFKELKAWSIDTTTRRQSEEITAEDWLQDRLRQLSLAPYNEWTSVEFNPNELMSTVHELKKETIRMSSGQIDEISGIITRKKTASCSAESEIADSDRNYDTGSAFNSRSSSLSSGPCGGLRGSHSDTKLYERSRSLSVSARRNSSSSMSCVSGFDASESSSMHDSDKLHCFGGRGLSHKNRRRRWSSRDNISSSCSSRSSGLEDDNSGHWTRVDEKSEETTNFDALSRQLQLKYGVFKETDEENIESTSKDWASQCLITPRPIHVGSNPNDSKNKLSHSPDRDTFHKPLESGFDSRTPKLKRSHASDLSYYESISPRNIDTFLYGTDLKAETSDPQSRNSSAYTSAESLDNFKYSYVTEREQQLFTDIRNLAVSCEANDAENQANTNQSTSYDQKLSDSQEQNASNAICYQEQDGTNKSPDITQFKYKGTKGFGRSNKINFRTNVCPNSASEKTGVEIASDRNPESRCDTPDVKI